MSEDDLQFLQTLSEPEFTELVLIPLLHAMHYTEIRNTHGPQEYGKDLVFADQKPLEGEIYYAGVVKQRKLKGAVSDSLSIREVVYQAKQAISEPFIHPSDGRPVRIERAFFFTSFPISQTTIRSISGELQLISSSIVFVDGPRLLDLIRLHCPVLLRRLSDRRSLYAQVLLRRFLEASPFGRLGVSRPLTFLDLYTGGELTPTTVEEARYISFAAPQQSTGNISLLEVVGRNTCAVVLADVGGGKTTSLQKLAIDLSQRSQEATEDHALPIFVSLADFTKRELQDYNTFRSAFEAHVRANQYLHDFSWSDATQHLVLLDAFDELPGEHAKVAGYICTLSSIFRGVVVTSRPTRIPEVPPPFEYYALSPFADTHIEEFLRKWFGPETGLAGKVLSSISNDSTIHEFCRSPLMLTLYSILATRERGVEGLPRRRTDIYDSIVSMLLGDWDRRRGIVNSYSPELKQHALEMIAYGSHTAGLKRFGIDELMKVIARALSDLGQPGDPESVFWEILYRSSLIRRAQAADCEFVHLSFQEHLCAHRLARLGEPRAVSGLLTKDWWRGPLRFYFGIKRTLDGVRIPRRTRQERGVGLRLMELSVDADFTSSALRKEITQLVGQDLLRAVAITDQELRLCERLGDDLLRSLLMLMDQEGARSDANVGNFFRVLAYMRSEASIDACARYAHLLDRLSLGELLSLAQTFLVMLESEPGRIFFGAYCRVVAASWGTVRGLTIFETLQMYHKVATEVRELQERLEDKAIEQKVKSALYEFLERLQWCADRIMSAVGSQFRPLPVRDLLRALSEVLTCEQTAAAREVLSQGTGLLLTKLEKVKVKETPRYVDVSQRLQDCHELLAGPELGRLNQARIVRQLSDALEGAKEVWSRHEAAKKGKRQRRRAGPR